MKISTKNTVAAIMFSTCLLAVSACNKPSENESAVKKMQDAAHEAADAANKAATEVAETANSVATDVSESAEEAADSIAESADDAATTMKDAAQDTIEKYFKPSKVRVNFITRSAG